MIEIDNAVIYHWQLTEPKRPEQVNLRNSIFMSDWYYEYLNKVIGPISSRQLLDKLRTGEIAAETPVRKNDSQWVPAVTVGGLYEAASRKVGKRICPYCGHEVFKVPTVCGGCERYIDRAQKVYVESPIRDAPRESIESEEEDL